MIPGSPQLIGIDTNIILRAVLGDDEHQSPVAAALFRSLTPERRGFITQVALAEVFWVLSRLEDLPRERVLETIRRLVETDTLEFDDGETVARALIFAEGGADFADALIEGTMKYFGTTETVTFDRGAAEKLGWRLLEA